MGVPLEHALEAEPVAIPLSTWHTAIRKSPVLRRQYSLGRAKFLVSAMARLAASKELRNLQWLLERRFAALFAKPEPLPAIQVTTNTTIELPEDFMRRVREYAQPVQITDQTPAVQPRNGH